MSSLLVHVWPAGLGRPVVRHLHVYWQMCYWRMFRQHSQKVQILVVLLSWMSPHSSPAQADLRGSLRRRWWDSRCQEAVDRELPPLTSSCWVALSQGCWPSSFRGACWGAKASSILNQMCFDCYHWKCLWKQKTKIATCLQRTIISAHSR